MVDYNECGWVDTAGNEYDTSMKRYAMVPKSRKSRKNEDGPDLQQFTQMIQYLTRETPFSKCGSNLNLSIDAFDTHLSIRMKLSKKRISISAVRSLHVSHCWLSYLDTHIDHNTSVLHHYEVAP